MQVLSVIISACVALASIVAGAFLGGRAYVISSAVVVICAMVPFFVRFEERRPGARELAIVAVMCALPVAARAAFAFVPHFKPMAAIIMIAGLGLGPSSGFLVGATAALVSNFIFGQGPWTPWQMMSFGLCGLAFGALSKAGAFKGTPLTWRQRALLAVSGCAFVICVAGPLLDTSTLFHMMANLTPESAAAVYLAGLPVNCIHGVATAITLALVADPVLSRLERIKRKHGI